MVFKIPLEIEVADAVDLVYNTHLNFTVGAVIIVGERKLLQMLQRCHSACRE